MTDKPDLIDEKASDSLSIAPTEDDENDHVHHPRQNAGQDGSIATRLERDPENKEARLDNALDESMDASDPPSSTQPVHNHGPAKSSGYDEREEERLKAEPEKK